MKKSILSIVPLLTLILFILSSCGDAKKLAYFNDITKDTTIKVSYANIETKISKNDILQINISTLDEATTRLLNAPGVSSTGYLVDETGIIKLALIGQVKAEGLTKKQLADYIADVLVTKKFAKEPIVTVRITNFKITVLGEVSRPGVIPVPSERITLPEALGMAGDLTAYGKRNTVLLIREINGERITKRFSLNESQMFNKDIYNLQNQDIIYVQPNDAKAAQTNRSSQYTSLAFSAISLLLVIYTQFIR